MLNDITTEKQNEINKLLELQNMVLVANKDFLIDTLTSVLARKDCIVFAIKKYRALYINNGMITPLTSKEEYASALEKSEHKHGFVLLLVEVRSIFDTKINAFREIYGLTVKRGKNDFFCHVFIGCVHSPETDKRTEFELVLQTKYTENEDSSYMTADEIWMNPLRQMILEASIDSCDAYTKRLDQEIKVLRARLHL